MTEIPNSIGPVHFEKAGRRLIMRFHPNDTIRLAIKAIGAHFEPTGPYWWIGTPRAALAVEAVRKAYDETGEKQADRERRSSAGLLLKHPRTFDCKTEIKALGAIWDKANNGWLMPDQESFDKARAICDEAADEERRERQEARDGTRSAPGDWKRMRSKYKGSCEYTGRHIAKRDWIWWSATGGVATGDLEQPPEIPGNDAILLAGGSGYGHSGWCPKQVVRNVVHKQVGYRRSSREKAIRDGSIERRVDEVVGDAPAGLVARPYKPGRFAGEDDAAYASRVTDYERLLAGYDEWSRAHKEARASISGDYPLDGPEWLYVQRARANYIREDGMSFGVGDEEGHVYTAWCRSATAEEAAPAIAKQEKRATAKQLSVDATALFQRVFDVGEYVQPSEDGKIRLEGPPVYLGKKEARSVIYGGGRWFVIEGDYIWAVRNNGADGDDWSHNNIHTGGAGAIGRRMPIDGGARLIVEKLAGNSELAKAH